MSDWGGLLEFCETDRQRQVIEMRLQGLSVRQIAEEIGIAGRNVQQICKRVRISAAAKGFSPAHDMYHTVPDGYKVKGTSTLYKDGAPVIQWVKSDADKERQLQIVLEAIENASDSIKPFAPTPKPKTTDKDLCSLLVITDFHLGMYAWEAEAGDSWDISIAKSTFLNAVNDMIEASPKSEVGILCQLGDFAL